MFSLKRILVFLALSFCGLPQIAFAQCPGEPTDGTVAAMPTRPVITDGADVIQKGVVELEGGWASGWPGGGVRQDSFGSLYKMGLFCNFEFRSSTNAFQSQTNPDGSGVHGLGDIWYSAQYRFLNHTAKLPSLAVIYASKQATASESKGLGTGQMDQLIALAVGKPVGKFSLNFESKWIFSGRPGASGHDKNAELSFNIAYPLTRRFGLIGEIYGDTQKNLATPGFASNLWAVQYTASPRLILDTGIDLGITNGAPHKRVFIGVSYAIGDLYKAIRGGHTPAPTQAPE